MVQSHFFWVKTIYLCLQLWHSNGHILTVINYLKCLHEIDVKKVLFRKKKWKSINCIFVEVYYFRACQLSIKAQQLDWKFVSFFGYGFSKSVAIMSFHEQKIQHRCSKVKIHDKIPHFFHNPEFFILKDYLFHCEDLRKEGWIF